MLLNFVCWGGEAVYAHITRMKFFLIYLFFPFDLEKCGGWQEMFNGYGEQRWG